MVDDAYLIEAMVDVSDVLLCPRGYAATIPRKTRDRHNAQVIVVNGKLARRLCGAVNLLYIRYLVR